MDMAPFIVAVVVVVVVVVVGNERLCHMCEDRGMCANFDCTVATRTKIAGESRTNATTSRKSFHNLASAILVKQIEHAPIYLPTSHQPMPQPSAVAAY